MSTLKKQFFVTRGTPRSNPLSDENQFSVSCGASKQVRVHDVQIEHGVNQGSPAFPVSASRLMRKLVAFIVGFIMAFSFLAEAAPPEVSNVRAA